MPGPDPNDEVRAPSAFKLRSNLTSIFTQEPIGVPFPGVTSCEPGLPNWVLLLTYAFLQLPQHTDRFVGRPPCNRVFAVATSHL